MTRGLCNSSLDLIRRGILEGLRMRSWYKKIGWASELRHFSSPADVPVVNYSGSVGWSIIL